MRRSSAIALCTCLLACAEDTESQHDGWDDVPLLAQEAAVEFEPTSSAGSEQPILTSLPVQLSNSVTLQSCTGTRIATSTDSQQLEISFTDGYRLDLSPNQLSVAKDCQIHINVSAAKNMKFVATAVTYNGTVDLRARGVVMIFQSEIYWQSKVLQLDDIHRNWGTKPAVIQGPVKFGWTLEHPLEFDNIAWGESECLTASTSDQLVLNTRFLIQASRSFPDPAAAQLTSIQATATGGSSAKFALNVRTVPCTPAATAL